MIILLLLVSNLAYGQVLAFSETNWFTVKPESPVYHDKKLGKKEILLAIEITKVATKYNIDRNLFSCILKVESGYRTNVVSATSDYGIGQINKKTAESLSINLQKVLSNRMYALTESAKILKSYKDVFSEDEPTLWFCRYNIGYQSYKKAGNYCQMYANRVNACLASQEYL